MEHGWARRFCGGKARYEGLTRNPLILIDAGDQSRMFGMAPPTSNILSHLRRDLVVFIGVGILSLDSIIEAILRSKSGWNSAVSSCELVMLAKEMVE